MADEMTADDQRSFARATRFRPPSIELSGGRSLQLGERTLLMGVVNATPDSFYASSRTPDPSDAIERGLRLVAEGADILDIGGESTRPGAEAVEVRDQLERILPVIEGLRKASQVVLSIDTRKAAVASAALQAGADIVNDTSALLADPGMAEVVASTKAIVILMHMRGEPRDMATRAFYEDVVLEVKAELGARIATAARAGIAPERQWIDPGIGFAKRTAHSLEILQRLEEFRVFERPLLVGVSRKSFIGDTSNERDPSLRLEGSLAAGAIAAFKGAHVLRVHDVAATRRALGVIDAIINADGY